MKGMRRLVFPVSYMVMLIGLATSSNAIAQKLLDPMERPARMSGLASKSVLLSVAHAGKRLVAVGEHGDIVFSDDQGVSWRQASVPVSVTLTAVRFATAKTGWAVGHSGLVLHTTDGGQSWTRQLDGKQAAGLVLKAAESGARSCPAGAGQLNPSPGYAKLLGKDGPDKPFFGLYFENEQKGFILGAYNLIFHTEDGGKSWQPWQGHLENPKGLHLYAMVKTGNELFIAGEQGLILRSSNNGETFGALRSPYGGSFFGLLALRNGGLLIFGLGGHAFRSNDQGATWEPVHTGVSASIMAGKQLRDETIVLVTESGELMAGGDNGDNFRPLRLTDRFPFADLAEAENGNLVLVGMRGVEIAPRACPERIEKQVTETMDVTR
jgi:photosystem II stability/assembly factor-like uncharacterized protein